ncbi:MAG TPA: hypothetical protein VNQ90_12890 [Chthoniobacteraceae bacterium]|nr:hypothetical protein [Chthoniobacteraceae bacterium]
MSQSLIVAILVLSAGATLFGARGRWTWILLALMLIFAGLGAAGLFTLESGTQETFRKLPLPAGYQAWTFTFLILIGAGGMIGLLLKGGTLLPKFLFPKRNR